jgi:hypothetical protein
MSDVVIRYSRLEDFTEICKRLPPVTSKCYTVEYKGIPVVIAGIVLSEYGAIAYMQMAEKINAPSIKICRYARKMLRIIAQDFNVVYAGVGVEYPNSRKFLSMLGFEYYCDDPLGGEIYRCQASRP